MRYLRQFMAASLVSFSTGAMAKHHNVNVGKGGDLVFDPEEIEAHKGDTITYYFFAANHTVTQSSFDEPCVPLEGGFFSAFTPNESEDEASPTTFTITVDDTTPIWVYCSQAEHCQAGMVQAINAPKEGNTLDAFKEAAEDAPDNLAPGDGLPVGGERVTQVEVGVDGEFIFEPAEIHEPPGTTVRFSFNPANHSVSQSSFDEPCVPLDEGFSSGFVPTEVSPSGVLFDVLVKDADTPLWFYCAQGEHCKSGMVGSINAPEEGDRTHEEFVELASDADAGIIDPNSPVGGLLTVNGTAVAPGSAHDAEGNPVDIDLEPLDPEFIEHVPEPDHHDAAQQWLGMAGGGIVANYEFADDISDTAVSYLHLMHFLDNILLRVLFTAQGHLHDGGKWQGAYPQTVVTAVSTMAAQAWVHRATATDSLQHYGKPLLSEECAYKFMDGDSIDEFLAHVVTLLSLEIGLLIETSAHLAHSDPWLVPILVTSLGAKSRMAGYANMMQGHAPAAAPREVSVPGDLVYAYAMEHYVDSCPTGNVDSCPTDNGEDGEDGEGGGSLSEWGHEGHTIEHQLKISNEVREDGEEGRLTRLETHHPSPREGWVAWIGPWGELKFTELVDGDADVPGELYGHAWVVIVKEKDIKLDELAKHAIAGPEMIWVTQP